MTNSTANDGGAFIPPKKWANSRFFPVKKTDRFKFKEDGIWLKQKLTCRKCGEKRRLRNAKYHFCNTCTEKEQYFGEICDACGVISQGEMRFLIMRDPNLPARGLFCYNCYKRIYEYGLSIDEMKRIIQADTCEVCGVVLEGGKVGSRALVVDHDHESGVVRGILCTSCNKAEGYLRKSRIAPEVLVERIIRYVNRGDSSR